MGLHELYAEQVIAARDSDLVKAHKRIKALEELALDVWKSCPVYGDDCMLCDRWNEDERDCDLHRRMRELGIGSKD